MATWDATSTYFSGQGVMLLGDRDVLTGRGYNFLPVGNVSEVKLGIGTTSLEHKESQSGQRGTDLRLTTEIKSTLSMVMENFNPVNLAIALRGSTTPVTGATVTAETNILHFGRVSSLNKVGVSTVVARRGATVLTAYTNITTAWDYRVNAEAGSIMFNDGQQGQLLAGLTTLGTPAATTFVAISGSKMTVTFASVPAHVYVGGRMAIVLATGADAAFVNSKSWPITAITATTVEVELGVTGKTITGTGTTLCTFSGDTTIQFDYVSSQQVITDALTAAATEKYVRFEGLNTASNNKSTVVEVFRFLTDPLKELSLISDTVQQYSLEGSVLADSLQQTGSKYFKLTQTV